MSWDIILFLPWLFVFYMMFKDLKLEEDKNDKY
jgi:hypothetical protein